ncbi:hypothetical protein M422DRAFT_247658 [Sphaerobolus stellatus SS14]|nr:hypothetical protein M422DRAFT_247658 [Sphaerobolus stellatus SS14]
MVKVGHQDFYIFEPALAQNGVPVMPFRFFTKDKVTFAKAWIMEPQADGWIIAEDQAVTVQVDHLMISFPHLTATYCERDIPDPRLIIGSRKAGGLSIHPWTCTSPEKGN